MHVISAVLRSASDASDEGQSMVTIQQLVDRVRGYCFTATRDEVKVVADRFLIPLRKSPDIYSLSMYID